MKMLSDLINGHKIRKFPSHPQDDDLDDLILELAEFDSWIIGSALTVLDGKNVAIDRQLEDICDLCNRLRSSRAINSSDATIKLDSISYCESLVNILNVLKMNVVGR